MSGKSNTVVEILVRDKTEIEHREQLKNEYHISDKIVKKVTLIINT